MPRARQSSDEDMFSGIDLGVTDEGVDTTETPEQSIVEGSSPSESEVTGEPVGEPTPTVTGSVEAAKPADARPPEAGSGRFRTDKSGNIVDESGKIVAKAGVERRLYERARDATTALQLAHGELQRMRDESQRLHEEYTQYKNSTQVLNAMPTQLGLSPQEAATGLRLFANFKANPVETVKYIMSEARAMGHNLEGIEGAVDTGAIARMIDQRLQPILQDRDAAKREQAVEVEARREYERFINNPELPFARVHEVPVARLLRQFPNLTPEAAYYKLNIWAVQNGFDFSQPLEAQIAARQQNIGGAQQQRPTAPIVHGNSGSGTVERVPVYADPSESFDSIVRQAMQESGLQF